MPPLPYVHDKRLLRRGLFLSDLPDANWIEYVKDLEADARELHRLRSFGDGVAAADFPESKVTAVQLGRTARHVSLDMDALPPGEAERIKADLDANSTASGR